MADGVWKGHCQQSTARTPTAGTPPARANYQIIGLKPQGHLLPRVLMVSQQRQHFPSCLSVLTFLGSHYYSQEVVGGSHLVSARIPTTHENTSTGRPSNIAVIVSTREYWYLALQGGQLRQAQNFGITSRERPGPIKRTFGSTTRHIFRIKVI